MKSRTIPFLLLLIFFTRSLTINAQTDSTGKTKVEFKVGAFYNSHLNYYGRTDSLKSSGFFPVAELWVDEAFYVTAAPVFVNNSTVSFDYAGTVATIGYQFSSEDKKWMGNLYGLKPFYEKSSQLVQSALKAQAAFSLSNINKAINVTGGADVKFSDKVDYG